MIAFAAGALFVLAIPWRYAIAGIPTNPVPPATCKLPLLAAYQRGISGLPILAQDCAVSIYLGLIERGIRPSTALGIAADAVVESRGGNKIRLRHPHGARGAFHRVGPRLAS